MTASRLVTRAAWGARAPKKVSHDIRPAEGGVAVHHIGADRLALTAHSRCVSLVRSVQETHMNGEYDDIAYSFLACPHGSVFEGRGYGVRTGANGTKDANDRFYAVCSLTGGTSGAYDPITADLVEAVRSAIAGLRSLGGAGARVVGHRDVTATECPGALYAYVTDGRFDPGGTGPGPGPENPPAPGQEVAWPGVLLHHPPLTVHWSARTWQERMRGRGWTIDVDGAYGAQSRRVCLAFQQEKGLTVDGVVGPGTWQAAWRAPVTGPADGDTSHRDAPAWPGVLFTYPPGTRHPEVATWQNRMRERGWSLDADGIYGSRSREVCLAFQRKKRLTADGTVGPATWQAAWTARPS
ncbi:N-acetylmuramoyl-L-alanine amidase [Streptomyces sp. G44]|uniref:peptidoglycan recognition protein family protein n=1 Tax=Streptomyces sp. G44 TaxID=2807632 RepID=UPI001961A9A7|nr:N-acetylmuramoyl-L-alanine amidase [Streptomyces sp. G44]MBM7168696.1 N-acetylmuramoyl-L-alanine amidase [Streptomyces sp. G44]